MTPSIALAGQRLMMSTIPRVDLASMLHEPAPTAPDPVVQETMIPNPIERYDASLRAALNPTWLFVSDTSDGHTKAGFLDGRALHPDGLELHVLVVARVERFGWRGTEPFEQFEPFEFFQNSGILNFKFKNFRKFKISTFSKLSAKFRQNFINI